jgi:UDP-N-acetylmuramyl pentapeptide phosphotransferase/UDP-N-acetylglucosamine-1-phosphate transferase
MALIGLAVVVSGLAVAALLAAAARLPQATPGARSLHDRPVPRVGGIAIWLGWLATVALTPPGGVAVWVWGVPWLALVVVSLCDDFRSVGVGMRLFVHAAAAVWLVTGFAWTAPAAVAIGIPSLLLAGLLVAWSLNLYNFMDGNDGLAALMTIVGFATYGFGAAAGGASPTLFVALAAATVPFLWVNRPVARMFMGDVGAVPLGFLAAAFGLAGIAVEMWPAWFPALVFLPFLMDATVTLGRRVWRRERIWEAHRMHYYQRLNQLGLGHAGTLAVYGAWMLAVAASAEFCLVRMPAWGWGALLGWIAVAAVFFLAIDYHWGMRSPSDR